MRRTSTLHACTPHPAVHHPSMNAVAFDEGKPQAHQLVTASQQRDGGWPTQWRPWLRLQRISMQWCMEAGWQRGGRNVAREAMLISTRQQRL